MNTFLEIACFNIESCLLAQKAGAQRIEFCSDYESGGITPDKNEILSVRRSLSVPIHIIIRPRKGNFIYSKDELNKMLDDIQFCRENKIDGVVFGALNDFDEIDETVLFKLKKEAGHMRCTFHRAFDHCQDLNSSLELLIRHGIHSVLSSGGENTALAGKTKLAELSEKYSSQIEIIAGGNVRSSQFPELFQTKCTSYHSSAILDKSGNCNENEIALLQRILHTIPF